MLCDLSSNVYNTTNKFTLLFLTLSRQCCRGYARLVAAGGGAGGPAELRPAAGRLGLHLSPAQPSFTLHPGPGRPRPRHLRLAVLLA